MPGHRYRSGGRASWLSACLFPVLSFIVVILFSCVQQEQRVRPLLRCDLRRACHVVSDPFLACHRLAWRVAIGCRVIVRFARAASPPFRPARLLAAGEPGRFSGYGSWLSTSTSTVRVCPTRVGARARPVDEMTGHEPPPRRGRRRPPRGGVPGRLGESGRAGGRPSPGPSEGGGAARQAPRAVCTARPAVACSRSR